ncbi:MAG: YdeI/OmpD-associated family protein [Syntrophothermus sp.]
MGKQHKFTAVIESGQGGGAFVSIPFDVEQAFGKKRVKIKAAIDGEPYRGLLVRMGTPCHILGVLKEIREKTGKNIGDSVQVVIEEDLDPRVIEVPDDLQKLFKSNPQAESFFEKLSYTHQKEYVKWIGEAKKDETRLNRLEKTIDLLLKGKKAK